MVETLIQVNVGAVGLNTIFRGVVNDSLDNTKSVGIEEHRAWKLSLHTLQHGLQGSVEVDGIVVNLLDALPILAPCREHRRCTTNGTHVGNDKFPHPQTIRRLQANGYIITT
jgi:hypothetical protein